MLVTNFTPFPLIETERLLLRKVYETDVNEIFFLRSDERVMKYIDKEPAKSTDEALHFIKMINDLEKNNDAVTWALTMKGNDTLIGTICYWNIMKEHYRAEIGYLLRPEYWGKGIMQEAFSEVVKYGFEVLKLHSLEANVNPDNTASIKLLEKNNFVREAYFRQNYFYNGKFLDSAIYSLLTPTD
ncbi:MAG: N-acetyltransferase [Ignavibacteriales bacterium]|nr:MAG: N-acetyltransferase [Ignavibacteriales bacterium]